MLIPIVGAVGRIIWGTLGDKMSLRTLFVSGNGLSVILQVTATISLSTIDFSLFSTH